MRKSAIKQVLSEWNDGGSAFNYSKGYPLGPLAEEYIAKIAPKSKKQSFFKMPIRMPTTMEYYEEDVLAESLKEIIEICKDLEQRKNQLALCCDFSLNDLMRLFDLDQKGTVNFREFREVYDVYKIHASGDFLRLAFIHLDHDLD